MIKKVIKYSSIFLTTLIILLFLLVTTAKIPRGKIEEQLTETMQSLGIKNDSREIKQIIKDRRYGATHIYADIMLLNIIYYIDSDNPLASIMEAKYYAVDGNKQITYDFNEIIEGNVQANRQYMRYWHGSMSIIRPLLVFFNLDQIYKINAIVLTISAVVLLILLIKTEIKELVIAYIVGLISCAVIIVPFCLEYYWTFLLMFIVSIIAIILDKKQKKLNTLFLITGMITCYLDFLSTEVITVLIPILLLVTIRYNQNRLTNMKEGVKFLMISMLFWAIGYIGMWIAKWILASMILQVNAWDYVKHEIQYRINASGYEQINSIFGETKNLPIKAVIENIKCIFPVDLLKKLGLSKVVPICVLIMEVILIRKKELEKLWFSGLLLMIAMIPYIRYMVIANHSYTHCCFTFRSQIISIMAIILAIIYSIDKENMKKEIKIRK